MRDDATEYALRVLLIDDQKTMRNIMRELLHQIGIYDVDEAEDGAVALEFLRDYVTPFPDLIICDLHMEHMDGIEFCNAVRRDKTLRNQGVPVVILTGDHDPLLHEVAEQVGAVSVVTKPITAVALKQLISDKVGFALAS
jgi:CheY-like chemotaxis protein